MNERNTKSATAIGVVACLLVARLFAQAPEQVPSGNPANDNARLLAGLPPLAAPALIELTKNPAWQRHAKYFDTAWAELETNQLSRVRAWAREYIPEAFTSTGTVFYMFSGPDFLYANTFFPQGTTYVLCGIEPIGPLPDAADLPPGSLGEELAALQSSLNSVLNLSFFITKQMKSDFSGHRLSGTLPILYIFLARSGMTIKDVGYVGVDAEGVLTDQADGTRSAASPAPGVRIRFTAEGSNTTRTLYYFSTDISDGGAKRTGFLKFCKTLAPGNSCVKSASYLMHESYFSEVRTFLLENTTTLVQDDSGVPVSFFTPDRWLLRVFGAYPGPIPLFKNRMQAKLAEYYRTTNPVPLDFGIGYRHRARESTLMVATRAPAIDDNVPSGAALPADPPQGSGNEPATSAAAPMP